MSTCFNTLHIPLITRRKQTQNMTCTTLIGYCKKFFPRLERHRCSHNSIATLCYLYTPMWYRIWQFRKLYNPSVQIMFTVHHNVLATYKKMPASPVFSIFSPAPSENAGRQSLLGRWWWQWWGCLLALRSLAGEHSGRRNAAIPDDVDQVAESLGAGVAAPLHIGGGVSEVPAWAALSIPVH
jgi:hypothetical protein